MKNKIALLLALAVLTISTFCARALLTTNIVPITVITSSTTMVNGNTVATYSFSLPPPKFILNSYSQTTNVTAAGGTNTLGFGASVSISPTNAWMFPQYSTNAQTDTHSGSEVTNLQFNVTFTGYITNAGGTNTASEQIQF